MGATSFWESVKTAAVGALLVGLVLVLALPRHAGFLLDYVDAWTLAFCFTFFGHYVDRLLAAIPGIDVGLGRLVRVGGWFAGGLWCYLVGRWLWFQYGRDLSELPGLVWGGVFLVVLLPAMHAVARRRDATL